MVKEVTHDNAPEPTETDDPQEHDEPAGGSRVRRSCEWCWKHRRPMMLIVRVGCRIYCFLHGDPG